MDPSRPGTSRPPGVVKTISDAQKSILQTFGWTSFFLYLLQPRVQPSRSLRFRYAIQKGVHVMLTKPPVMTVAAHRALCDAARAQNVLVQVEYHKRFDPIYSDARQRIRETMGDFQSDSRERRRDPR